MKSVSDHVSDLGESLTLAIHRAVEAATNAMTGDIRQIRESVERLQKVSCQRGGGGQVSDDFTTAQRKYIDAQVKLQIADLPSRRSFEDAYVRPVGWMNMEKNIEDLLARVADLEKRIRDEPAADQIDIIAARVERLEQVGNEHASSIASLEAFGADTATWAGGSLREKAERHGLFPSAYDQIKSAVEKETGDVRDGLRRMDEIDAQRERAATLSAVAAERERCAKIASHAHSTMTWSTDTRRREAELIGHMIACAIGDKTVVPQ